MLKNQPAQVTGDPLPYNCILETKNSSKNHGFNFILKNVTYSMLTLQYNNAHRIEHLI